MRRYQVLKGFHTYLVCSRQLIFLHTNRANQSAHTHEFDVLLRKCQEGGGGGGGRRNVLLGTSPPLSPFPDGPEYNDKSAHGINECFKICLPEDNFVAKVLMNVEGIKDCLQIFTWVQFWCKSSLNNRMYTEYSKLSRVQYTLSREVLLDEDLSKSLSSLALVYSQHH